MIQILLQPCIKAAAHLPPSSTMSRVQGLPFFACRRAEAGASVDAGEPACHHPQA